ncbi:rotamase-domain-containing protein [Auricularia subglabra TFB-10046 SS5]|uniref:Peptidyl-prolyl cis-trans isomerase n=1 Tax=Auricularia subglabra (strain TFB-10046 / SS5) TaxID=717982 RepID=J0WY44_AURST|nr:rotamase-domain-containing protein [Auricularia subglabra TFB-10046 SS5]
MVWEIRMSQSRGMAYYFNTETKTAQWEPPAGVDVNSLPGADYLASAAKTQGQVRASHLLVKHSGSRRPSSWKEDNITRSKAEAEDILRGYQAQIGGDAAKFAALAQQHSDCSSHARGGDLGWFGPGQMQRPFEEATYALQPGQMSDIISTESGVHLILRTA